MNFYAVLLAGLLCLNTALAGETRDSERRKAQLDPDLLAEKVVFNWQGGRWKYQNLSGSYRFVITESEITAVNGAPTNKLYIQWWNDKGEISYSLSVNEINTAPSYQFNKSECIDAACSAIKLSAIHGMEEYKRMITITLMGLGRYSISLEPE